MTQPAAATTVQRIVTCTSPVNIAVIKYWGKRNEELILPTNSSMSATLNQDDLKTVTTMVALKNTSDSVTSSDAVDVEIWLNGKKESLENERVQNVLREMKQRYKAALAAGNNKHLLSSIPDKILVVSENNFPTAAGLASSASGYCCLVYTMAHLFGLLHAENKDDASMLSDLSAVARQGSGSACRSMFGGWAKWDMGQRDDGVDSLALPVAPQNHWHALATSDEERAEQEVKIMICVVNDMKKHTSSTGGMRNSVATSKLMKVRIEEVVPRRMVEMEQAILKRDFAAFAEICMADSDDFHAVCRDTTPAIHYLNDTSFFIIDLVHQYNSQCTKDGKAVAAYTFDAGPNAVLYIRGEKHFQNLKAIIKNYFEVVSVAPTASSSTAVSSAANSEEAQQHIARLQQDSSLAAKYENLKSAGMNKLKYIIETTVGDGPRVLSQEQDHLVHADTLSPKRIVA